MKACGAVNAEGDRCALPADHNLHQDGIGEDWGVRWGYESHASTLRGWAAYLASKGESAAAKELAAVADSLGVSVL